MGNHSGGSRAIETPEDGTIWLIPSYLAADDMLFYEFESRSLAPTIFQYSPDSRSSAVWHAPFSPAPLPRCESRVLSYKAKDGIRMGCQPYHTTERSRLVSQPLADSSDHWIVFDGRLDNYQDP
jgi:hypothetical protein